MTTVVVKIDIFGVDGSKPYPKEMQMHDYLLGELCKFNVGKYTTVHFTPAPVFNDDTFVLSNNTHTIAMQITEDDKHHQGSKSHLGVDKEAMRIHMESAIKTSLGAEWMKTIHQSWTLPHTEEEPMELHIVTSIGVTNVFARKMKDNLGLPNDNLAINGSVAYLTDGHKKIVLRKEIRNIEISADLAHSQFKQGMVDMFSELGTILNTIVPMLQQRKINSVEMPMGMGLLIASSTLSTDNNVDELIITLSISGDEHVAWQYAKQKSEDDIILFIIGEYNSYDRFRNYFDYDFLQLWGGLIQ